MNYNIKRIKKSVDYVNGIKVCEYVYMTSDHRIFPTELDAMRHIKEAKKAEHRIDINIYQSNRRKKIKAEKGE